MADVNPQSTLPAFRSNAPLLIWYRKKMFARDIIDIRNSKWYLQSSVFKPENGISCTGRVRVNYSVWEFWFNGKQNGKEITWEKNNTNVEK